MPSSREKILAAVTCLVVEAPAFTYEQLAAAAGVSRQTLYTHFPERASLFVGLADRARQEAGVDQLAAAVFEASTAREALAALIDVHVAFTPAVMTVMRAEQVERLRHPEIEAAFEERAGGRRPLVRHVVTRLRAENLLAPHWTVEVATDLVAGLFNPWLTAELLELRAWSVPELRERLLVVLENALLTSHDDPKEN
jgi:AcrR family transcriptional regulator